MNDDFLRALQEEPRAEFAAALYLRISQGRSPTWARMRAKPPAFRNLPIIVGVVAVAFLVAAGVRTYLLPHWIQIGDIWIDVRPIELSTARKSNWVQIGSTWVELPGTPWLGLGGESTFLRVLPYEQAVALSMAAASLGYGFEVPTWAPRGFALGDQVSISAEPGGPKYLYAVWEDSAGGEPIRLLLHSRAYTIPGKSQSLLNPLSTWPVAAGNFQEIEVKGRPAVLVRGDWNWPIREVPYEGRTLDELIPFQQATVAWNRQGGSSLYWADGDNGYMLWTYAVGVRAEDLVAMAESAR